MPLRAHQHSAERRAAPGEKLHFETFQPTAALTTGQRRMPTAGSLVVLLVSNFHKAELQLDRGKRHPEEQGFLHSMGSA